MKKHSARVAPLSACNSPVLTLTKVEGNAGAARGGPRVLPALGSPPGPSRRGAGSRPAAGGRAAARWHPGGTGGDVRGRPAPREGRGDPPRTCPRLPCPALLWGCVGALLPQWASGAPPGPRGALETFRRGKGLGAIRGPPREP